MDDRSLPDAIPELSLSDEDEFSDDGDIKPLTMKERIYGFSS